MMLFNRFKRLIVIPVFMCLSWVKAQEVIEIKERRVVKPGETLTIKEGTIVKMSPGAHIDVRGSLNVNGTKEKPVIFLNADPQKPGLGIIVSGIQEDGIIQISEVQFDGLLQPLRFDPFWYRKRVNIQSGRIFNATSSEPVVYVASPFIDLRPNRRINFVLSDISSENNASGFIVESVGSNGINHEFKNLYFGDNTVLGGEISMGMMHLDFAESLNKDVVEMGSIAFVRNFSGSLSLGLSVSGTSKQSLKVDGFYGDNPDEIIFDQKRDPRIPLVNISKAAGIAEYGKVRYIKSVQHTYGDLRVVSFGDLRVTELRDANGDLVEITRNQIGDTQVYHYIQGVPVDAYLNNGRKVKIPINVKSSIPSVTYTKVDTAEYNKYLNQIKTVGDDAQESDKIGVGFKWTIPTFAKKGEIVKKLRQWEFGVWGGGAFYGGGDIKHKRLMDFRTAPSIVRETWFIKGIPLISTIDLSLGLYGQYNVNSRFSLKFTGYRSTISIHDLYATGLFGGTRPLMAYNRDYELFTSAANSYRAHFSTNMWIGEIEGLWHLRSYDIKKGKKSKLVPTLGLSLGIMHYTPYRYAFSSQRRGEERKDYVARMKRDHKYNLRDLGSEGQHFIAGASPYSTIAFNVGSSFSLTYLFKRFALKWEIKGVYTSTDYLDDFGPGFWYGGDVNALRANHKIEQFSAAGDLNKITGYDARIAPNAPRSTDGLNDWYFQAHLGLSYRLFKK